MKYSEKIIRLANRFEHKLQKYSEEADSSVISTFIVGTVGSSIKKYNLQTKLANALVAKRDLEWEKGKEISGDVTIGEGGTITAKKSGSSWTLDPATGLNLNGTLLEDPSMKPIIMNIYNDFLKTTLFPAIKAVLDSYSRDSRWNEYDTISGYQMPNDTPKAFVEL